MNPTETERLTEVENDHDDFVRLPGLFRRSEIERVDEPGNDFRFEEVSDSSDGTSLFAVYRREPHKKDTGK